MSDTEFVIPAVALLATLALLGSPLAAAGTGSMDTSRILGDQEVNVTAKAPTLLLRDADLSGTMELEGDHMTVEHIDDWREVIQASTEAGTQQLASYNHRNETVRHHPNVDGARLLGFSEPNATVIVEPLEPAVELSVHHLGNYDVQPVEDRLLEHSHYVNPNTTKSVQYYEYRAEEKVSLALEGRSQVRLDGSFQVYLWGASAEIVGNDSAIYETGHRSEDRSRGTQTITEEHFEFARVRVTGGSLTLDVDQPRQMAAFAEVFHADPGAGAQVVFEDAEGLLPGPESSYQGSGDALSARDGAYQWTYGGDHVSTATLEAPAEVAGGQPVAVEEDGGIWSWAFVLVAGVMAVTAARGPVGRYVDAVRAWLRERRVERWMEAGDRLTSVRDYASAHKYYCRVTERYPEISEAWYSQGIVLQEMSRHDEASRAFVQAHETISEDEPELVDMAAVEAWRAGEENRARELFEQLAILDPIRLRKRLQEPGFSELRTRSWMRELLDVDAGVGVQYA